MKEYRIVFKNIIDNTTNVATLSLTEKEYKKVLNDVVNQNKLMTNYVIKSIDRVDVLVL